MPPSSTTRARIKTSACSDVSKHYHLASFHQSQECFEVTFNKKKFDSLSKELQAILRIRFRSRELELLLVHDPFVMPTTWSS